MSSFFQFSSSSSSVNTIAPISDDPHLEVTVTPSSSAFYAGETFSVTITLRNTRIPHSPGTGTRVDEEYNDGRPITPETAQTVGTTTSSFRGMPPPPDPRITPGSNLPRRKNNIGTAAPQPTTPEPQEFKSPLPNYMQYPEYPYSPGANPTSRAGWPKDGEMVIRSPETWRRSQDLGVGKGHSRKTRSWALGNKGNMTPQEMVWSLGGGGAPPLPSRRPGATTIPESHPHSRKISINTPIIPADSRPGSPTELPSIPESRSMEAGPSRPSSRNTLSSSASGSTSRLSLNSDSDASRRQSRSPLGQDHARTPSYQNACGSSYPTPPTHPYSRQRQPTEPWGTTTVLWAYTRLIGQFHPSNQYIPPDPLLPLRSLMLHQPVGSGSLTSTTSPTNGQGVKSSASSRWQLSFGTGAIGHKSQPSLTGSLFGLAKDLVTGGGGGTLEEERRRVWQAKDLPVFETARSLLGVDIKLKEGESNEFTYTIELPKSLPPAHRGRAFRFSYDLVVSLTVLLPGQGKRQKSKDIHIPIRIWANISLGKPIHTYDVLRPIIQTKDEAIVESGQQDKGRRRSSLDIKGKAETVESFRQYADHLLETVTATEDGTTPSAKSAPLSPSRIEGPLLSPHKNQVVRNRKSNDSLRPSMLDVPNGHSPSKGKARQGSFVQGDDELLADAGEEGDCGQAVEVLSRHSTKTSYDIAKEGEIVSVLTLVKTTYLLGETVLGVVTFNQPSSTRRVLKVSAFLESHELIPEALLPLSASSSGRAKHPNLSRLHAEFRASYAVNTSRLSFSLDIPSDSTPDFHITAGHEGFKGGLEWKVRISFLVAVPHRHGQPGVHLLPLPDLSNDDDNTFYAASTGLSPLVPIKDHGKQIAWEEMKVETVECEVPIKVLAGNTAFVVRPSVYNI